MVLEWVYGAVVPTVDKARDVASCGLGAYVPSAVNAHQILVTCVGVLYQDQRKWSDNVEDTSSMAWEAVGGKYQVSPVEDVGG